MFSKFWSLTEKDVKAIVQKFAESIPGSDAVCSDVSLRISPEVSEELEGKREVLVTEDFLLIATVGDFSFSLQVTANKSSEEKGGAL